MLVCGTLFFTGSYDGEVMREKTGKGDDRKRGHAEKGIYLSRPDEWGRVENKSVPNGTYLSGNHLIKKGNKKASLYLFLLFISSSVSTGDIWGITSTSLSAPFPVAHNA